MALWNRAPCSLSASILSHLPQPGSLGCLLNCPLARFACAHHLSAATLVRDFSPSLPSTSRQSTVYPSPSIPSCCGVAQHTSPRSQGRPNPSEQQGVPHFDTQHCRRGRFELHGHAIRVTSLATRTRRRSHGRETKEGRRQSWRRTSSQGPAGAAASFPPSL